MEGSSSAWISTSTIPGFVKALAVVKLEAAAVGTEASGAGVGNIGNVEIGMALTAAVEVDAVEGVDGPTTGVAGCMVAVLDPAPVLFAVPAPAAAALAAAEIAAITAAACPGPPKRPAPAPLPAPPPAPMPPAAAAATAAAAACASGNGSMAANCMACLGVCLEGIAHVCPFLGSPHFEHRYEPRTRRRPSSCKSCASCPSGPS